jgi:hypothetical protein
MIIIISIVYLVTFAVLMFAASKVVYEETNNISMIPRPTHISRHRRNRSCYIFQ